MVRPAPVQYLQPDEQSLRDEGRHPLSIMDHVLGMTVLAAVLVGAGIFMLGRDVREWVATLVLAGVVLVAGLWLVALVAMWFRVVTSRYVITDERVYRSHGRLRFSLTQTTYDKVTDLHVTQSVFGRLGGFGTVVVQTAGTGLALEGVRDPFQTKRDVERARSRFIARLLEEHRVTAPRATADKAGTTEPGEAEAVAVEDRETHPLWRSGPVFASFLPNILSGFLTFGIVLVFILGSDFPGPVRIGLAAGAVLLGFFTLLQVWIAYRHTRYEVHPWGVVATRGWIARRRVETTFDKVTDVATYQGVVGRLLDFGNITINTAGSNQAPVVFQGLSRPAEAKQFIDEARRRASRRDR